ncbi:MAG: WD40 repeat domain-containing protein [Candidatus Kariarchaeaceae archaeon]|jgi:WD40 repeat protein
MVTIFLFGTTISQSQPKLKWPIGNGTEYEELNPDKEWEFTLDGQKIVTTVQGCSIKRIWDIGTGRLVTLDPGCSNGDPWIEFQPSGDLALTRFDDNGPVQVWEVSNGKVKFILKGFTGDFSPDGNLILTESHYPDSTWIWDANTGKLRYGIEGAFAEFSPDGKWVINGKDISWKRQKIRIYESNTGKLFRNHKDDNLADYYISKDNTHFSIIKLVKRSVNDFTLYDFTTGKKINSLSYRNWHEWALSWDNKWCIFSRILDKEGGIWRGEADILQLNAGKFIKKITWSCCKCCCLDNDFAWPSKIIFSTDGKYFYMHINCSNAGIFESVTGNLIHTINIDEYQYGTYVEKVEFSPDGNWLLTSNLNTDSVKIWNTETGKFMWSIPGSLSSWSGIISHIHRDRPILLINDNEKCTIVSLTNGKPLITFDYIGLYDWVVTHPSGLFDASPGAMEKLYFVQDGERIELDSLKDKYYEPGLWEKVMSGEPLRILED